MPRSAGIMFELKFKQLCTKDPSNLEFWPLGEGCMKKGYFAVGWGDIGA